MTYRTIDPSTGELIEEFETLDDVAVDAAVNRSAEAFQTWRFEPFATRGQCLVRLADLLEANKDELGRLMALEMGKPLAQGISEAEKCAWVCRHYAEEGERLLRPDAHTSDGAEAYTRYEALGPIVAVMPWNFPFWQVFRFLAPAFALGNTMLLKHAPNVPQCAEKIIELSRQAGVPEGVAQNLFASNAQVARMIEDSRVRGVTLTGSGRAGRAVGGAAGAALKPSVLELGGSDSFSVFADADLDEATRVAVQSRCLNNGQSCIAAKRFFFEDSIYDRALEMLVSKMEQQTVGAPLDEGTQIGPIAREDLRDELTRQVERIEQAGGRVLTGGRPIDGDGFFFSPGVIVDLDPTDPMSHEELFGPVAAVYRFGSEDDLIRAINDSPFGLGASLWTEDEARRQRLIPRIEAGSVFVGGLVKSDPRLPFGGVKDSGYGRELAREGLLEFANTKTVWVAE